MRSRVFLVLVCLLSTVAGLCACGAFQNAQADCPFSHFAWTASAEEIIAEEGTDYSSYDSVYGGVCYTYPKEYEGLMGTVKYMFDGDGSLASMAWAYSSDSQEELLDLYEKICASVSAGYGESGYKAEHQTSYGGVWYRENGDIILSTMITSENKALQFAYLSPAVSKGKDK